MTDVAGGLDEPEELQPEPGSLALASVDDEWTRADWEHAAAGVLRKARRLGADDPDCAVWQALARTTHDGISITPLGTPELVGHGAVAGRPTRVGPWDVRSAKPATTPPPCTTWRTASTSLWVDTGRPGWRPLDGVRLDLAPVVLAHGTPERVRALLTPAGERVARRTGPRNLVRLRSDARVGDADDQSVDLVDDGPALPGFMASDATVVHDQGVHELGASDAQEVGRRAGACALLGATDAGLPLDAAAALLEFRYAVTDEQFPTIAKLRAARRLWARVLELSGAERPWPCASTR